MICTVILAAGESRRMGTSKLLLPFGKKTMIETIVDEALRSKSNKTLVVLGAEKEKIERILSNRDVDKVVNTRYQEGMLSSVQAGLDALTDEVQAVLVCLGDQPYIPFTILDRLIDAYKETKKGIILPTYRKQRGHPVLIDTKYKPEIKQISPETGLRALMCNHPQDVLEVEVDTPQILKDIDKPEDYMRELKKKEEA
jgi:molybdenum cofactor cytidylyltransferase